MQLARSWAGSLETNLYPAGIGCKPPPDLHWKKNAAFSIQFGETQVSRTTSPAFLSSRMATKVQCLRCPASVHSTNATWQTSFGLTHRHCSIFSAVNDSPHREALFSGRFLKGHWAVFTWANLLRRAPRSSKSRYQREPVHQGSTFHEPRSKTGAATLAALITISPRRPPQRTSDSD